MATVTPQQLQPRNQNGHYLATGPLTCPQIENQKRRRAKQWKQFRVSYLYSQQALAEQLGICRRTVTAIENGTVTPTLRVQKRFRDLVRKEREEAAT